MKNLKSKSGCKGLIAVEAALILPLFLLLIAGIVDFGRVLMIQQVLTYAAREGVRSGAVRFDDAEALAEAELMARSAISQSGLDPAEAGIVPAIAVVEDTSALRLRIDYPFHSGLAAWIPGMNANFELHSQAFMRREA